MAKRERSKLRFFKKTDYFILGAAFISFVLSVVLFFNGDTEAGIFVAIWVPSILGFANYIKNKIGEM
ncbi:MAG: hypothetical protein WD625_12435 [Balneolales bacterium]